MAGQMSVVQKFRVEQLQLLPQAEEQVFLLQQQQRLDHQRTFHHQVATVTLLTVCAEAHPRQIHNVSIPEEPVTGDGKEKVTGAT
jgi:hypothetical protein